VQAARAALAKLKFHPRDTLPNRTALARADAVYAATSGQDRMALGRAIAVFQAAIDSQDSAQIAAVREQLLSLLDSLRRR
jgi:molecular chaperone HscC